MITVLLAFAFAAYTAWQLIPAGVSKFDAEKSATTFTSLGGDTVRYFVGVSEVVGPLLLLYSGTALIGATLISVVMLGAIYLHVVVWKNSPKNALIILATTLASAAFSIL
jgi:uncharacterized membrane protein YphA (DoxX/SURF4 family)